MDGLIESAHPPLWIHGHTHASIDTHVGKTRIVCNPHGYMTDLNGDFRPKLVVQADSRGRGVGANTR